MPDITPALLPPGRLAEIAAREAKATPGPWRHEPDLAAQEFDGPTLNILARPPGEELPYLVAVCDSLDNAEFIAAAITDIRAQSAHIATMEALLYDLESSSVALAAGERRERERCLGLIRSLIDKFGTHSVAAQALGQALQLIDQPTTGPALPADLREENARLRRALVEIAEGEKIGQCPSVMRRIAREALEAKT